MHTQEKIHPSLQRLYALALEQFSAKGPTQVGRLIGESSQVVNNWGRGGVSKLGAVKIQTQLGWSAQWIREGLGPRRVPMDGVTVAPLSPATMLPPRLVRRVPIVGQLIKHGDSFMIEQFKGDLDALAAFTGGVQARALQVSTDAFFPRLRQGEYVVVAEEGHPDGGEDVVVHIRGDDGTVHVCLYQFLYKADGVVVFQHFKNENIQVTLRDGQIVKMEPVIGIYNRRAKVAPLKNHSED